MAESKLKANFPPIVKAFTIGSGGTVTLSPSSNSMNFDVLLFTHGVRAGINSAMYYITGYSQNSSYHVINPIINGSGISIMSSNGTITLTNNSSDTITVTVEVIMLVGGNLNMNST